VLYVFYEFETTQNTRFSYAATLHVPYFVCQQQFCSSCEEVEDVQRHCLQCDKRKHTFWEDTLGSMISYLCDHRPWANKIVGKAHNAKAFDLHFILNRAFLLKWQLELIMNGLNIM